MRINPLSTEKALADLAAIAGGPPDGILLPKTTSAADVVDAGHYLSALETGKAWRPDSIRIMAVATETPIALFTLGTFAGCSPRLAGMTWGAEDLSSALGAATNRDNEGNLEFTYRLARSLCLAAAVAADVQPHRHGLHRFSRFRRTAQGVARGIARRVSPARSRFIPIRCRSSTMHSRRPPRTSRMRGAWSRRSRRAPAPWPRRQDAGHAASEAGPENPRTGRHEPVAVTQAFWSAQADHPAIPGLVHVTKFGASISGACGGFQTSPRAPGS